MTSPVMDLRGMSSRGSRLAEALGMGLGTTLSQRFEEMQAQKKNSKILEALSPYFEETGMTPEQTQQIAKSGMSPEQGIQLLQMQAKKKQASQVDQETLQGSLDRMLELSSQVGWSPLPINYRGTNAGDAAEFESSKSGLVAAMRDRVNKGVLSNQKFQYIVKEILPSHGDREDVKRRKLQAVARELGLKYPGEQSSSQPQKDSVMMLAPDGSKRMVPKDKVEAAKKAGGRVIR